MPVFPSAVNKDCVDVYRKTESHLRELAARLKIEHVSETFFSEVVAPLTVYFNSMSGGDVPVFIGFTGGQGSGKTTLSEFVQLALQVGFDRKTVGFSIDDIYKTREQREHIAKTVHPMCEVRGVPGTHDVQLGLDTLDSLCEARADSVTAIPAFSKPLDQHLPEESWQKFEGRPDFIFFDAWCGGARPLSVESWKPPMNLLEEEEDPSGVWSKWSNQELAGDYQQLFDRFDLLLLIKVPSMQHVYESRWLQEQTLEKTLTDPEMLKRIMTKEQVFRFVMYYERLTRYVLEEMPDFADIVLDRNEGFEFSFSKQP